MGAMTDVDDRTGALPHWEVDSIFPGLASRELTDATEGLVADVGRLRAELDDRGIRGGDPRPVTPADVEAVEVLVPLFNELLERMRLVGAYLHAHITTDATDAQAATLQSRFHADTASVATFWVSAARSCDCAVRISNCLWAWAFTSAKASGSDFALSRLWAKSKAASVLILAISITLVVKSPAPLVADAQTASKVPLPVSAASLSL